MTSMNSKTKLNTFELNGMYHGFHRHTEFPNLVWVMELNNKTSCLSVNITCFIKKPKH